MKAASVPATIGRTPDVRLARLCPDAQVRVKNERSNPGGSIKDRIAPAMIEAAEASGELAPVATIIEPASGNPGVGLALLEPGEARTWTPRSAREDRLLAGISCPPIDRSAHWSTRHG